jgi:DNA repair exonuclease SbcCD nuclease subunit
MKFKEECMDRLPCPAYAIPGNHDSYSDSEWFEFGKQSKIPPTVKPDPTSKDKTGLSSKGKSRCCFIMQKSESCACPL